MPFETVKRIINNEPVRLDSLNGKEYMMLKILSNDYNAIESADRINKYLFCCNPTLVRGLLYLTVQKNLKKLPKFVKKSNKKTDMIDNIIHEYFSAKNISFGGVESEYFDCRDIIRHHLKDEETLREVLTTIRADEKMFKKMKVSYKVPDPELVKKASQQTLAASMAVTLAEQPRATLDSWF